MIRLVYLLRRKPELSLEEFHRIWRDDHGPLVAFHQVRLDILRYVQLHYVEDPSYTPSRRGAQPAYDGAAELWFESEETLKAAMESEAGRGAMQEILADEAGFIDLPESPLWLAHEYPQINAGPEPLVALPKSSIVKLHYAIRHPQNMTLESAQTYWRTVHGPLVRANNGATGSFRYIQVHRFESPLEAELRKARGTTVETYMGHAEGWYDRSRQVSSPESKAAGRAAFKDEANFIDVSRSTFWIGKEHVLVDRWY